ncbi:MAG TPA: S24/S26 family peptidase [Desulfobaccales bacterium]
MNEKTGLWLQGLRQGRAMRFLPAGGSMSPFFRGGDIVTIEPGGGCRVGEVVLRCHGSDFMLHRVVAKSRDRVITKGDALSSFDLPDNSKNILGRAVLRERQGKVRDLNTFWFRFAGMAFSLTITWVPNLHLILREAWRRGRKVLRSLPASIGERRDSLPDIG